MRQDMHEILKGFYKATKGHHDYGLVDFQDQDHAMIVGLGTRAGLYHSIMHKPPNVAYVYPMTEERYEVEVPESLQ